MGLLQRCRQKISQDFNLNSIRSQHFYKSQVMCDHKLPTDTMAFILFLPINEIIRFFSIFQWDDICCEQHVRSRVPTGQDSTHTELPNVASTSVNSSVASYTDERKKCTRKILCQPRVTQYKVNSLFLLYRGLFALVFIGFTIFSTTCQPYLYIIFLTNWSLSLQTVYYFVVFLYVLGVWWKLRRRGETQTLAPSEVVMVCDHGSAESNGNNNEQIVFKMEQDGSSIRKRSRSLVHGATWIEKSLWIYANVVYALPYCVSLGYWFIVYTYSKWKTY